MTILKGKNKNTMDETLRLFFDLINAGLFCVLLTEDPHRTSLIYLLLPISVHLMSFHHKGLVIALFLHGLYFLALLNSGFFD